MREHEGLDKNDAGFSEYAEKMAEKVRGGFKKAFFKRVNELLEEKILEVIDGENK